MRLAAPRVGARPRRKATRRRSSSRRLMLEGLEDRTALSKFTVLNVADRNMPQEGLARLGDEGPLGRVAQPEEIAPTYVYLASDADSSYTVGEVVAVTGGLTDTR